MTCRAFAEDPAEHFIEHRKNLDIAVIVDRGDAVSTQMEGIDHVDIVEICGSGLVGEIDRVFKRKIPDRESLKLCISGADTAFVFVVELGEAGRHLSASRSRCSDNDERSCCLNIIIFAISVFTDDERNIFQDNLQYGKAIDRKP